MPPAGRLEDLSSGLTSFLQLAWLQPYSGLVLFVGIGVLVAVFAGSIWHYWSACRRIRSALASATARLTAIANERALATEWEALSEELAERPILGEPWGQFAATVLVPDQPGRALRQAEPVEGFLELPTLLSLAGISPRFHRAVPNILVGIGLLFTFLGLIIALGSAGDSVGAPNPEVSRGALKGLLDAAGVKFFSSLVGLLLSILALVIHKGWETSLDRAVRQFAKAVTRLMPPVTSLFLIEQTNELARDSQRVQETMFNDLAVKIGDRLGAALDDTLGRHLAAQMEPLRTSMDRMADTMGRMNQDALERMVQSFGTLLQDTAGTQMRGLAEVLGQAATRLAGLTEGFEAAGKGVRDAGQEAARDFRDGMAAATQGMRDDFAAFGNELQATLASATAALSTAATDGARELRSAASGFAATVEPLRAALAELPAPLRDAAAAVTAQVELLETAGTRLEAAGAALQSVAAGTAEATASLLGVGEAVRETAGVLGAAGTQGAATQERLRETATVLRTAAERFEGLDRQIAAVFAATETGLRATTDRIAAFAQDVDKSTASAVTALGGAINDLHDVLDDMPRAQRGPVSARG